MCLSIPAKVEKVDGEMATVTVGGAEYQASLSMVDDVKPGDYILLHTGFALEKISPEEAEKTLELFDEFRELNEQMDEEEKAFRNQGS